MSQSMPNDLYKYKWVEQLANDKNGQKAYLAWRDALLAPHVLSASCALEDAINLPNTENSFSEFEKNYAPETEINLFDPKFNKPLNQFIKKIRYGLQQVIPKYQFSLESSYKFAMPIIDYRFFDTYLNLFSHDFNGSVQFLGELFNDDEGYFYHIEAIFLGGSQGLIRTDRIKAYKEGKKNIPRLEGGIKYFLKKNKFKNIQASVSSQKLNTEDVQSDFFFALSDYLRNTQKTSKKQSVSKKKKT